MWFAPLIGALLDVMGSLAGQVLIALGIGYFTYSGLDTSIAWAKAQFFTSAGGLPPLAIQIMGILQLDQVVSMLVSAVTMRMTMKGMAAGAIKLSRLK